MEDSLASAHLHKKLKTSHLDWQETLNQSVLSIVSIRFSQVSSFDTEPAEASEATGFIVDKDLGLILTNRHVVCSGPFVGECVFHDHEEVDVFPVYRDPVTLIISLIHVDSRLWILKI
jgi:S1-C subfamily serine protease